MKCFLFTAGSVSCVKRFTNGSRNSLKDVRKSRDMPDQVRKWLRQQSKYFYAAGFDALIKRWDKCVNVGAIYVEKQMLFPPQVRISYVLHFISICDLFTDSSSHYFCRKSVVILMQVSVYEIVHTRLQLYSSTAQSP
jgi:hypothetical protein